MIDEENNVEHFAAEDATIKFEPWFMFQPEDDITLAEIAMVFQALNIGVKQNILDRMPESAHRHFKVKE